jgi:outer membrane receptor protein involved in Fe transport
MPEFTNSYEVSSIFIYDQTSFNLGVYHRYTTDIIERVSRYENNINTFRPENIGTNNTTGLELNGKYSPNKVWTITGDLNYSYFDRKGVFENSNFNFSSTQWSSKTTIKMKLPSDIDFEITWHYQSKYQTVQGEVSGMHFADLGLRKKILKGRGVFNISVRDVLASRIQESVADQPDFRLYNWTRRGRFLTLGFSYGFGKGEAMEYLGQKRRH